MYLAYVGAVQIMLGKLQTEFAHSFSSTLLDRLAKTRASLEELKKSEEDRERSLEHLNTLLCRHGKELDKWKCSRGIEEEVQKAKAF